MSYTNLYARLKELQKILWLSDDRMDQSTLFTAQDMLANILLDVAEKDNKTDDLVAAFPWLYSKE